MRLQRISAYEIKAYLTQDDLVRLGIKDAARLDCGAADLILNIARSELDFAYEKNNCEIYTETCGDGYTLTVKASGEEKRRSQTHKCVLCFDSYETLKCACLFLRNFDIQYSELRSEGDERAKTYYLLMEYGENGPQLDNKPYFLSSVSELCCSVHTDKTAFFYYISEHSAPLIQKNAVYDIAKSEKKW
ncbi:MAG: hypothetical protein IJT49_10525 [Clostridia bacterium]|nr:hypothetical protein [Clostridia bacterium]